MKFGVVVFPGSNCDHDAFYALGNVLRKPVEFIWHQSEDLRGCDAIVLPGGFSYGDYLRTGAIARFSPVMKSVEKFAKSSGLVLGICNGFQILLEAGSATMDCTSAMLASSALAGTIVIFCGRIRYAVRIPPAKPVISSARDSAGASLI